jgi:magnesium and cobalt exporter, CNNM family
MFTFILDLIGLVVVPLLVVMNAFFVAAEFSLVTVRWTRVEELVEEKKFGALAVRHAVENLVDSVAATQVGITFTSLALGWVGEPRIAHLIEPWFAGIPAPWTAVASNAAAIGIAFLAITSMHVVLGELVPKALALERAEDIALLTAGPLLAFARVFRPFIRVMRVFANGVVKALRLPPLGQRHLVHSVDELTMLLEETKAAGAITPDEASYARNVFELSEKTAGEIMVPREKVVMLSVLASEEEVLATARDTAHTRMPVWEDSQDNIVGIVNTKDLFHLFSLKGLVILMDAMYPALFVTPDVSLARLLLLFRREKRPMAVVRDRAGKFLGIVTLEDVLEEIVGEIEDEHDVEMAHGGVQPAPVAPAQGVVES